MVTHLNALQVWDENFGASGVLMTKFSTEVSDSV
jgi:hypothetical protein